MEEFEGDEASAGYGRVWETSGALEVRGICSQRPRTLDMTEFWPVLWRPRWDNWRTIQNQFPNCSRLLFPQFIATFRPVGLTKCTLINYHKEEHSKKTKQNGRVVEREIIMNPNLGPDIWSQWASQSSRDFKSPRGDGGTVCLEATLLLSYLHSLFMRCFQLPLIVNYPYIICCLWLTAHVRLVCL